MDIKRGLTHPALIQLFRSDAVLDRQIDEMIGIIKGVMADGMVDQAEVEFLLKWMEVNSAVIDAWPARVIYPRIVAALADGHIDQSEERELMALLMATVGGNTAQFIGESSNSTTLPYTRPQPSIDFNGALFCLTGQFASGTREWCSNQIMTKGGRVAGNITKKLNYLVIGDIGNQNWAHSTYGRKIEKAIEYIDGGVDIAIIGEQHWYDHLTR